MPTHFVFPYRGNQLAGSFDASSILEFVNTNKNLRKLRTRKMGLLHVAIEVLGNLEPSDIPIKTVAGKRAPTALASPMNGTPVSKFMRYLWYLASPSPLWISDTTCALWRPCRASPFSHHKQKHHLYGGVFVLPATRF
jgi:hypothetical protein